MNRFKRQLVACSLISSLALPLTAMAGMPSHAPQGMGLHQGPHLAMMAALDLTDEQRNALQETRQTFREEHQALREQERTAIADILTEEQRASLRPPVSGIKAQRTTLSARRVSKKGSMHCSTAGH